MLGVEGLGPPTVVKRSYGIAHACALAIGLTLSLLITKLFGVPSPIGWLVRALDPPDSHMSKTTKNGLATILGAAAAGAVIMAPLTTVIFQLMGTAFLLAGLRYLPSGLSRSTAFMSAGVVLATATTTHGALFRMEAAAISAVLVVAVFLLTSFARDTFFRPRNLPIKTVTRMRMSATNLNKSNSAGPYENRSIRQIGRCYAMTN